MSFPARAEIYWANLSPSIGSEIDKKRPVLIVSNDVNNEFADTVTILPITSSVGKVYPFEVFIPAGVGGLQTDSKAKANQIRTIDKQRLLNKIGVLDNVLMEEVNKAMMLQLAIECP